MAMPATCCARMRSSRMAVGRLPETGADLCSQPTMTRLENLPGPVALKRMMAAMVELFCDSFEQVPRRIVLDIDDTEDNRRCAGPPPRVDRARWRSRQSYDPHRRRGHRRGLPGRPPPDHQAGSRRQPAYSTTSSTRARIDCGIVRPSALAVFRFMTNLNFPGSPTGRSAGLPP